MKLTIERNRLAVLVVAFIGHYPALRLLTTFRMTDRVARFNLVAAAATVAGMVAVGLTLGGTAAFITLVIGHVCWGLVLAREVPRTERLTACTRRGA
jgi:hypothetical protein